jgi:hypothetical protein
LHELHLRHFFSFRAPIGVTFVLRVSNRPMTVAWFFFFACDFFFSPEFIFVRLDAQTRLFPCAAIMSSTTSKQQAYDYLIKLLLIGDSGVGKR